MHGLKPFKYKSTGELCDTIQGENKREKSIVKIIFAHHD